MLDNEGLTQEQADELKAECAKVGIEIEIHYAVHGAIGVQVAPELIPKLVTVAERLGIDYTVPN